MNFASRQRNARASRRPCVIHVKNPSGTSWPALACVCRPFRKPICGGPGGKNQRARATKRRLTSVRENYLNTKAPGHFDREPERNALVCQARRSAPDSPQREYHDDCESAGASPDPSTPPPLAIVACLASFITRWPAFGSLRCQRICRARAICCDFENDGYFSTDDARPIGPGYAHDLLILGSTRGATGMHAVRPLFGLSREAHPCLRHLAHDGAGNRILEGFS